MHGGTITRCKHSSCRAVISMVEILKPGRAAKSGTAPVVTQWLPIQLPPVLGWLGGSGDKLVVPRLRKIVSCEIVTPDEAKGYPTSDLILGSEPHSLYCPHNQ